MEKQPITIDTKLNFLGTVQKVIFKGNNHQVAIMMQAIKNGIDKINEEVKKEREEFYKEQRKNLEGFTTKKLRGMCKAFGIKNYSKMNKKSLIEELIKIKKEKYNE